MGNIPIAEETKIISPRKTMDFKLDILQKEKQIQFIIVVH